MSEAPGTRFEYCNGASLLLSHIISEVARRPASDYAADVLFGPLGIDKPEWLATPQGVTLGYAELRLHPHDMAGLLGPDADGPRHGQVGLPVSARRRMGRCAVAVSGVHCGGDVSADRTRATLL